MVEMPKEFVPERTEAMDEPKTFTGNRALAIEEPLIFEIGSTETSGVDLKPLTEAPLTPALSPRGEGEGAAALLVDAKGIARGLSYSEEGHSGVPSPLGERVGVRGSSAPNRLGGLERTGPIGLPGLSEPEAIRHYVRLSQKNYSIDTGIFPLGSCTMKHNPRPEREDGAAAGFRRHPSAAAGEDGAGRAGSDGGTEPLAA